MKAILRQKFTALSAYVKKAPHTTLNSKWINNIIVRPVLWNWQTGHGNFLNALEFIGKGKDFLNRTPEVQALRPASGRVDPKKLQRFCIATDTIIGQKRQPAEQEKTLISSTSDRGSVSRIYKVLKKLKRTNNQIKMGHRTKQLIWYKRLRNVFVCSISLAPGKCTAKLR